MIQLAEALRDRLIAQSRIFAAVSSHRTITGTGREQALANLLREILPRRVEVLSGVIVPSSSGAPSKSARQVDIIVADTQEFPLLARSGELAVVLPEAVRAVVEVKTSISGADALEETLKQISALPLESSEVQTWYSALFSFSYPKDSRTLRTVLDEIIRKRDDALAMIRQEGHSGNKLGEETSRLAAAYLPDLIVSDMGAIAIKGTATGGKRSYEFYECQQDGAPVVLIVELLAAITAEMRRAEAVASGLALKLTSAIKAHSRYLQVEKRPVLEPLPI